MIVLGIDPGLRTTGFGIITKQGSKLAYIASGTISTPTDAELPERLKIIFSGVSEIVRTYAPDCAVIEKVFVNVNPQSTLLLGQARGAAICAAASSGLVVHEYAALRIKQAVVGFGQADKKQVQLMVRRLLGLERAPAEDAADALACAICHAHSSMLMSAVRSATARESIASAPRRRSAAAGRRAWTVRLQGAK